MMIPSILSFILIIPLLGLVGLFTIPKTQAELIRNVAKGSLLLSFVLSLFVFVNYDANLGGFQFLEQIPWVTSLGISYQLGVDGINALMIVLTGLGSFCGLLTMDSVKERVKEFYILYLTMVIGTYAAFLSLDIFFFYFFHEIAAIPTFLMMSIWGSQRKDYAAMKLTLYLTAGASLALVGLIALFFVSGIHTFDFIQLKTHLSLHPIAPEVQNWIFPLIVFGFGITLTLWPFYTWAPVGYAEAPTAVSMMHAGVIKKLAAYAILRFAIQLMPSAALTWMPILATLAVLNILWCGLIALTQRDIKYLLGYSSCSHMGYIFLGLACLNLVGFTGVVYLMFSHGVLALLSFALTGYIEEQSKTRDLSHWGGLAKQIPFIGTCFVMAALASAGVPGFGNFVAEVTILSAAWDQYRWQTILAILGIVVTAIYMLAAIRQGFHGPLNKNLTALKDSSSLYAKLPFVLLLSFLIFVGCFPQVIINKLEVSTQHAAERYRE